jgi:ABC-2 type transport system ATP-binding protein
LIRLREATDESVDVPCRNGRAGGWENAVIQVQNLTKRYRDLVAVDNLNFEVKKGEILGFLGPNGAGKSTTMKILTGFMPASSGTAKIAGFDVFENPIEVKRRVGYLPETPPLYLEMTVHAYLKFCAQIKGISGKKIADEVERVANLTSSAEVIDRVINNISKGYRQRVGLAQALLGDPDVLILDEPSSGLDPQQNKAMREVIKSLAGRHTIILSTHVLPEVTSTCQKVLIISRGKVIAHDDLDALHAKHQLPGQPVSLEEIFIKLTTE